MSKQEVMMQGFWENYPFKIQMLSEKPKNNGEITPEYAKELNGKLVVSEYGTIESGEWIKLYWVIDEEQNRVVASRYQLFGSPTLRAVADMAALLCRNKTPQEIANIDYKSLEYFLRDYPNAEALPPKRRYLVNFVLRAVSNMIDIVEGRESKTSPIVCECANIDLDSIKESIKRFNIETLKELGEYTKAGMVCKECISYSNKNTPREYYLEDILKETLKEMEEEGKKAPKISDKPFKEMSIEEKKEAINATIDEYIRAMLVMDGGDMEILDVKENGVNTDIYIRYLGACSGCASASTGTLFAIEGILKQKLDPDIRVLPL